MKSVLSLLVKLCTPGEQFLHLFKLNTLSIRKAYRLIIIKRGTNHVLLKVVCINAIYCTVWHYKDSCINSNSFCVFWPVLQISFDMIQIRKIGLFQIFWIIWKLITFQHFQRFYLYFCNKTLWNILRFFIDVLFCKSSM